MPEAYEKWLVPTVFGPFAVDLAVRVAARSPAQVLEVAAGTGALTHELASADPSRGDHRNRPERGNGRVRSRPGTGGDVAAGRRNATAL